MLMMKRLSILLFMLACGIQSWAQDREVTGTVTDSGTGATLPGVNIVVKGTALGTATDADGKFRLNVPPSATALVISIIVTQLRKL